MALFLSETTNKVDTKGRVSVPAAFRAALAGQPFHGIVALPSFKYAAIQCGGMEWMEQLSSGVDAYDFAVRPRTVSCAKSTTPARSRRRMRRLGLRRSQC